MLNAFRCDVGFVVIVLFGRQGGLKDLPVQIAFSWQGTLLVTIFVLLPFVVREVMPLARVLPHHFSRNYSDGGAAFV